MLSSHYSQGFNLSKGRNLHLPHHLTPASIALRRKLTLRNYFSICINVGSQSLTVLALHKIC